MPIKPRLTVAALSDLQDQVRSCPVLLQVGTQGGPLRRERNPLSPRQIALGVDLLSQIVCETDALDQVLLSLEPIDVFFTSSVKIASSKTAVPWS